MSTLVTKPPRMKEHKAKGVRFVSGMLYVELTDGRQVGVPLSQFPWLADASPAQRRKWHIEPGGFAVYWDDLDDGVEVEHLLA